jgi:hypothetical protein
MRARRLVLGATRGEEGFALIMVIAIGAVLMILATVAVTFTVSGLNKTRTDVAANSAEAAAYAGIEEYQSRLSNDTSYTRFGNPAAQFSSTSAVTLPTGAQANPAFGIGVDTAPGGTWADVIQGDHSAQFRYEVDNSAYGTTGIVRLRSTGRVGTATRSIVANLKQQGFIDFLYFTDYEIGDPAVSGASASCVAYAWAGRSTSCAGINFAAIDTINGPVHSNDTLLICGTTFKGTVSTGNPTLIGSNYYAIPSGCGSTATFNAGKPYTSPVVGMPSTNSQMKKETRSDLTTNGVPNPGCLYSGPTSITYNTGGTMTVRSPWTKATETAGSPTTSGSAPAKCGTPGSGTGQLGSSTGQTFAVPTNTVIYVQNVPSVSGDPNYWGTAKPSGFTCTGAAGGKISGNGIGYPAINEKAPTSTSYGCADGDVFVKGTLSGGTAAGSQLTVAAENYVYVVGDLKYNDSSVDMLGLVGNNAVWVWNPVNSYGQNLLTDSGRRIDAALLSVAHTFQVQNYASGSPRGALTVNGAIAQKFRGPVGTGNPSSGVMSTGYSKSYQYDQRLKYTAPPKFLSPVTTTYGVTTWVEIPAVFDSTGAYN